MEGEDDDGRPDHRGPQHAEGESAGKTERYRDRRDRSVRVSHSHTGGQTEQSCEDVFDNLKKYYKLHFLSK